MSINPVQLISQIVESRLASGNRRPAELSPAPAQNPNEGSAPKTEAKSPQSESSTAQLRQDEVDVQRDSQTNGDVVIQYKDHTGNLILQVPSSEVLGVARAIDQDFREEAKTRALAAETEDKGENPHGH
jgi:uncharacterized FlaG/YvyC family protein